MSIIITNKGQAPGENETTRIYHISDNNGLIAEFTHDREDGLAECLRKAADAVDLKKHIDIANLLKDTFCNRELSGIPPRYGTNNCFECGKEPPENIRFFEILTIMHDEKCTLPICDDCYDLIRPDKLQAEEL